MSTGGSSKKRKTDHAELEQAYSEEQGPQPEVPEHLADIYGDDEVLNFANPLQDEESFFLARSRSSDKALSVI